VPLFQAIQGSDAPPATALSGTVPESIQESFARTVIGSIGFDFDRGRLDTAVHPFCSGSIDDTRLTTRYRENDMQDALYACLHEAGHGLYEQGFDPQWRGTPLAEARSAGIHESQSRFWENRVGRSRAFWQHWGPKLPSSLLESLGAKNVPSVDELYRATNRVGASFIRVEADELTYNLHVILRYRIEQKLMAGDLSASEVPAAWDDGMEELLGIRPPDVLRGALQDIHWGLGLFGYFPTYALGNCYAAALAQAMERDLPLDQLISEGTFGPVLDWLRAKVHRRGCAVGTIALLEESTGAGLSAQPLLSYLEQKYTPLYGLAS